MKNICEYFKYEIEYPSNEPGIKFIPPKFFTGWITL